MLLEEDFMKEPDFTKEEKLAIVKNCLQLAHFQIR